MKRILLPTDFSENSWNAIQYAMELYKEDVCTFYLLNAYTPMLIEPVNPMGSTAVTKAMLDVVQKNAEEGLANMLKRIQETYVNTKHHFETICTYEFFLNAVIEALKKYEISLIVMGTKGASGLKEVFIGSNTAAVMAKTHCTVLVIPEHAVYTPPREIAFVTDYDHYYESEEIYELFHIVLKNDSTLSVMHSLDAYEELNEEQKEIKLFLGKVLKDIRHDFYTLTNVSLLMATRLFIESRKIDMLCMTAKQHNFFERIFGKPRVEEISFYIKIPFLVLNEDKK